MRVKNRERVWLDTINFLILCLNEKTGSSYQVPPAQMSWTWSAWTELWWGLSLEEEELKPKKNITFKTQQKFI